MLNNVDKVFCLREQQQFLEEVLSELKHGETNKSNALNTLPAFYCNSAAFKLCY